MVRNGVPILLNEGDNVNKGDVVQAGSNSSLDLAFIDGTVFALASNARMVLNEMMYTPNGSNDSPSDVPEATKPDHVQPKSVSNLGSTPANPITPRSHADDTPPHADDVPQPAGVPTLVSIDVVPPNEVAGRSGHDTTVATGFTFSAEQRNSIFATASIEKLV